MISPEQLKEIGARCEKATGAVICETFNQKLLATFNADKYEAVPIQKYLASLNKRTDDGGE